VAQVDHVAGLPIAGGQQASDDLADTAGHRGGGS
jgi:hypothetical protein